MSTPRNWPAGGADNTVAGRRLVTDGGETFCIACGEPFDPERDACPACGRPVDGKRGTNEEEEEADGKTGSATADVAEGASPASATEATPGSSAAETELEEETDPVRTGESADGVETQRTEHRHAEDKPNNSSVERAQDSAKSRRRADAAGPNEEYCKDCGGIVDHDVARCPHCGRDRTESGKRPILAGAMSFFLAGAGQMYTGRIKRGAALLVVALLLYTGRIPVIGVWLPGAGPDSVLFLGFAVWAAYDAYAGAKTVNTA
jgi:TM2 domain-containing membrane protein YozV/RNA polymerase subunit RPABC4/transcription elongation factor Spt4